MKKIITSIFIFSALLFSYPAFSQIIKGTYAIKNVQTGMLMRIKDASRKDNTPLVAYNPVNWKCVTWNFNHIDGQTYLLENLLTGKTFQPLTEIPANGDELKQQSINNTVSQQYEFLPVEKNIYLIRLKGTDLYVTPSDSSGTVNAPLILSKRNNSKWQQWIIYEQHPVI
ncbi:MAG: RICIN domain-containing protein [Ginsengibacter sp.]